MKLFTAAVKIEDLNRMCVLCPPNKLCFLQLKNSPSFFLRFIVMINAQKCTACTAAY